MRRVLALSMFIGLVACTPTKQPLTNGEKLASPPDTEIRPVTDTYDGVRVTDNYRWLEDGPAEAVQSWSEAQNRYARSYLAELPHLDAIRTRVTEVLNAKSTSWRRVQSRGDVLFAMSWQPPKQQSYLVVMNSAFEDSSRVLVDPNLMRPDGSLSIDWYEPSPDGSIVAVSLSESGTEHGDVHFFEVETGNEVHEVITHVNGGTAGGSLAWGADGKGVFYSRYPREGSRPAEDLEFYVQVYYHRLGTDEVTDRYELGKEFPRVAEIDLRLNAKTGQILATVQDGDGGEFAHYLRARRGGWRQFSDYGDRTVQAVFGSNDDLYILSRKGAPKGKIVRVSTQSLDVAKGAVVVDEGEDSIVGTFWGPPSIIATTDRLFVLYQLGGPSEIRAFTLHGKKAAAPKQLDVSTSFGMTLHGDKLMFRNGSFVAPWAWYEFDPKTGNTKRTVLESQMTVPVDEVTVRRTFATSNDGTRVPVSVLLPKGASDDGKTPMLVTGYGGYGISIPPYYSPRTALLLEQGVGVAIANLRGGGEYGEKWHLQGNLINKQNVFDDFAAVLDHLVASKLTTPDQIVVEGRSNGGLLMGAALTQYPKKMKAVVSHVGIYDMLRAELSPNGAFNITEFGTVKDESQFKALYAYSPYHNVTKGTRYPTVLFLTGANDPRVDPMQSRKMTARLQAASKSPVLLRTTGGGHGRDTALDEQINESTDVLAFVLSELQIEFTAPR